MPIAAASNTSEEWAAGALDRPWLRSPLADVARGPADTGCDADLPVHRDFMQLLPEEQGLGLRPGLQRNPSISSALRESGEGLRGFASDASFSISRLLEVWPSLRSGLGITGCLLEGVPAPEEDLPASPSSRAPMASHFLQGCSMPMAPSSQVLPPAEAGSPLEGLPPLRRSGCSVLASPRGIGVNSSLVGESPGGEAPGDRSPQDAQSHCALAPAPPGVLRASTLLGSRSFCDDVLSFGMCLGV